MKQLILIFATVLLFSCNSDDDNNDGPGNPDPQNPTTSEYFITGDMAANNVNFQQTDGYDLVISSDGEMGFDPETNESFCINNYGGGLYNYQVENQPSMNIDFVRHLIVDFCEDEEVFVESFELGEYTFSNGEDKGAAVYYFDGSNNYLSTEGDQSGSVFTLSEKEVIGTSSAGLISIKVKGTFTCKVYNMDNPADFKEITNGNYTVLLESRM